jgi:DNA repair protein RecN (Recombination protein N)
MLKKLSVHNYALIRELEIEPCDGLTIITGDRGRKVNPPWSPFTYPGSQGRQLGSARQQRQMIVEGSFRIEDYDLKISSGPTTSTLSLLPF